MTDMPNYFLFRVRLIYSVFISQIRKKVHLSEKAHRRVPGKEVNERSGKLGEKRAFP